MGMPWLRRRDRDSVDSLGKEVSHRYGDFFYVSLESEMPCVRKLNLGAWDVLAECFRTGRDEIGIVPTPDCQQWRSEFPEVLVQGGIELDVVGVIEKQV